MANTITFFRIASGIVLLFCPVFSPAYYVFYIAAGVSDMLDGYSAVVVCALATFSAIQEGHFIRTERE